MVPAQGKLSSNLHDKTPQLGDATMRWEAALWYGMKGSSEKDRTEQIKFPAVGEFHIYKTHISEQRVERAEWCRNEKRC